MHKPLAIIDIGTNTALLLVARNSSQGLEILKDKCSFARLGEGLVKNECFSASAMDRVEAALGEYKFLIEGFDCQQVLAVGTAAFRKAKNADIFLRRIQNNLGISIKIISGEEEARLIALAVKKSFSDLARPFLVLDIGGGSTEFIVETNDGNPQEHSVPLGVVKLTEEFIETDPPSQKEIQSLKKYLQAQWQRLPKFPLVLQMVATAGTPTTLSAIALGLKNYEAKKVHGSVLTFSTIQNLFKKLGSLPLQERQKVPCLPAQRADVIPAGCLILLTVMEHFGLRELKVSDWSLRHGVFFDFLKSV